MIKLFIDNKQVELGADTNPALNYIIDDIENPTVVRNSYSKTINISGTKNNNTIFGDIWKLDREQLYSNDILSGVYYNPNLRVPFKLYNNSDLIMDGYVQLESITKDNTGVSYGICLYGGIGDFFYNLEYNDEGENRTLADVIYDARGEEGSVWTNPDDEFNRTINKTAIYNAFGYVPKSTLTPQTILDTDMWDWLTFIPVYQGLYDDFDNDKVIINTSGSTVFNSGNYLQLVNDGKTYTPYRNLARADLNRELTEWEIRDLRSYKQIPALRVRRLIEALAQPKNNGGYTVEFDNKFFNDNNPYWDKTYITLPRITDWYKNNSTDEEKTSKLSFYSSNTLPMTTTYNVRDYVRTIDGDFPMDGHNIDVASMDMPLSANMNVHFTFNLGFNQAGTNNTGVLGAWYKDSALGKTKSSVAVQMCVYNAANGELLGRSQIINFTSIHPDFVIEPSGWNSHYPSSALQGEDLTNVQGSFKNGVFEDLNGNALFELTAENIKNVNEIYIRVLMTRGYNKYRSEFKSGSIFKNIFSRLEQMDGTISILPAEDPYIISQYSTSDVKNNIEVTKKTLLTTENTPAQYLLSYAKQFGLYFVKDKYEKKISILTRDTFYNQNIEDINDKVDRNRITISPLTYDVRKFVMGNDMPETEFQKKYFEQYSVDYGCKKIDTDYRFNNEEKKVLDSSIFKDGITAIDTSQYYYNYKTSGNTDGPTMNVEYYTYNLFNNVNNDFAEFNMDVYPYTQSKKNSRRGINTNTGYDAYPKLVARDDKKNAVDITNTLVFYNGIQHILDTNGNDVKYTITDDIAEMYLISDGPCYLYTEKEFGSGLEDNHLAYITSYLPMYTRYYVDNNNITHSLDFGMPREKFVKWAYEESTTIYDKFWKRFFEDRYSVNARKVECEVLFDKIIDVNALRKFYSFDNSLWILYEVNDYDPSVNKPVKCTFVKIDSPYNYSLEYDEIAEVEDYIFTSPESYNFIYNGSNQTVSVRVTSSKNWTASASGTITIDKVSGSNGDTIIISEPALTYSNRSYITFTCGDKQYIMNVYNTVM